MTNTATDNVIPMPVNKKAGRRAEDKWSPQALKFGYTVLPNLLLRAQAKLGITPTQLNVLAQLAEHWWDSDKYPYPAKDTIARRMGFCWHTVPTSTTVARRAARSSTSCRQCSTTSACRWAATWTATRAAAAGGVTTIVDMPLNCIPVTTTAAALQAKLDACAGSLWIDAGFWGGVVPGNAPDLPADDVVKAAASAALGLPIAAPAVWLELDPDRGAGARLRGFALAAVLRQELRSSFGENWFESRRAGRYLRDIWSCGRRYDAEELAREVGAPGLRWDLVRDDLVGSTA